MTRPALAILALAALLPAASAQAPPLPTTLDFKAVDDYVAGQVAAKGFVGLSVAVMRDGEIAFAKSYGLADIAAKKPVTPDTAFAVGSITKQFTCACVMLLAEDGKLAVDDPVAKYYPHLTRAKDITLRDLMNHTSGYPDYYPLDFLDRRMLKPTALDALVKEYAGGKLDFEPGSRFSYSNTGFNILGGVVEKVSGKPFGEFLDERLLKPLKLTRTKYGSPPPGGPTATGYTAFALSDPEPAKPEADGWIDAAGALWSTPTDLLKWDLALAMGKAVKPESYRQMVAPRVLSNGKVSDYGFGLGVAVRGGEPVFQHTGGVSGFVSGNVFLPRAKAGLVVLSNTEHVSPTQLRADLFALLLKDVQARDEPAVPKVTGPAPKDAVLDFVAKLKAGKVDRGQLGEEFSVYLTDARATAAGKLFTGLGEPKTVEAGGTSERGGMEVCTVTLTYASKTLKASLYRSPDGKIQQLLFYGE